MKKRLAASTYVVSLTEEQFTHIIKKDLKLAFEEELELDVLLSQIDGITDADYNGHYGAVIIISLDADHDHETTWQRIKDTINGYSPE